MLNPVLCCVFSFLVGVSQRVLSDDVRRVSNLGVSIQAYIEARVSGAKVRL